jgi:hypothetical protein
MSSQTPVPANVTVRPAVVADAKLIMQLVN